MTILVSLISSRTTPRPPTAAPSCASLSFPRPRGLLGRCGLPGLLGLLEMLGMVGHRVSSALTPTRGPLPLRCATSFYLISSPSVCVGGCPRAPQLCLQRARAADVLPRSRAAAASVLVLLLAQAQPVTWLLREKPLELRQLGEVSIQHTCRYLSQYF